MVYQLNVYMLIMLASAVFAGTICAYAWRYRAAPGAVPLVVVLLTLTIWEIASALELAAIDAPTAIFWFKSQGALQLIAATAAFCFALEYAGLGQWLKRSILILLAIPIVAWVLLILTNDAHHQVWTHFWFDGYVRVSRGIVLYVFLGYGMLLSFFTLLTWLMLWMRWRLHRWLAGSVFVIILIARIAFLLDFGDLNPFAPLDPTILATNLTCLVYFIVLYRFQFFDVTPIARTTALEQADEGIVVLDRQNRIVELNPAAQAILNLTSARAIGQDGASAFRAWHNLVERLADSGATRTKILVGAEPRRSYDVHLVPLTNPRGFQLGRMLLFHDISDLERSQAQLLEQQRALATMQERERLARELHDSLGQVIGYVKMQAQAARNLLAQNDARAADDYLARLITIAQDAHAEVREYILGVKAANTNERAFFSALKEYLQHLHETCGVCAELRVPPELTDDVFEPMVAAQLLRIIQEAVTNVHKHARTQNVRVEFFDCADHAQIIVQDDGQGFDLTQSPTDQGLHFGLSFMRERAEQVGGRVHVHSAPGQGTRVAITMPLRSQVANANIARG